MHKLLIPFALFASLILGGCSSWTGSDSDIVTKTLDNLPLIYRPEIQQGNQLSGDQIAQLKTGLDKRQVRFLLGTPMLADVFHDNRWDYVYTFGIGSRPREIQRMSLFFENERLVRIDTDLTAEDIKTGEGGSKEILVSVPDYEGSNTFFGRIKRSIGLGGD